MMPMKLNHNKKPSTKQRTLTTYGFLGFLSLYSFEAKASDHTYFEPINPSYFFPIISSKSFDFFTALKKNISAETTITTGYLKGDFEWQIAADLSGTLTPNVLSRLTYQDLNAPTVTFHQKLSIKKEPYQSFYLHVQGEYGKIQEGTVEDSDFDDNNQTAEYSRSLSDPTDSPLSHVLLGLGAILTENHQHTLSIEAGMALYQQTFFKTNGRQVIATDMRTPPVGEFSGLNSSYDARWLSGFFAVSDTISIQKHQLTLSARFLQTDYQAKANWNLRKDFAHPVSFQHDAVGRGTHFEISYKIPLSQDFSLYSAWTQNRMRTDSGIDTVFFADGSTGITKLNGVEWKSQTVSVGVSYQL